MLSENINLKHVLEILALNRSRTEQRLDCGFKTRFLRKSNNVPYERALGTTYFFESMKFGMKICLSEIRLSTFTVFSKKILPP